MSCGEWGVPQRQHVTPTQRDRLYFGVSYGGGNLSHVTLDPFQLVLQSQMPCKKGCYGYSRGVPGYLSSITAVERFSLPWKVLTVWVIP